ncbi:hypothetical protein PM082_010739 [Marasmius tenuissimus]|nr:hypothetical protein PM082_010739 [Marasmius tenuissimus]
MPGRSFVFQKHPSLLLIHLLPLVCLERSLPRVRKLDVVRRLCPFFSHQLQPTALGLDPLSNLMCTSSTTPNLPCGRGGKASER